MASRPAPQPHGRSRGPVRISLPASVAYNADALKRTISTIVGQLGCRTCFSGADCHFQMERDLAINEEGIATASPTASRTIHRPLVASDVVVGFQGKAAFNLENVFTAVDRIIGQMGGCPGCHSGRDVSYLSEVSLVGVTEDLQVQQFGAPLSE